MRDLGKGGFVRPKPATAAQKLANKEFLVLETEFDSEI